MGPESTLALLALVGEPMGRRVLMAHQVVGVLRTEQVRATEKDGQRRIRRGLRGLESKAA